jgi:hypothetical protein
MGLILLGIGGFALSGSNVIEHAIQRFMPLTYQASDFIAVMPSGSVVQLERTTFIEYQQKEIHRFHEEQKEEEKNNFLTKNNK